MAEYRLSLQSLDGYHRQMSKGLLLFMVLLLGWIIYYNLEIQHGDLITSVPVIILSIAAIGFGMYRTIGQQKQVALSYRLLIEPASITRTQLNTPSIQLRTEDIVRITQNKKGDISIISRDKYQHIYIGSKIDNREQLLHELEQFSPVILITQKSLLERIAPFTSILMLALMASFYTTTNKIVAGITGISLLTILLWSAWQVWHNKNIQQHSRRNLWLQLIVIISIAVGLVAKLLS